MQNSNINESEVDVSFVLLIDVVEGILHLRPEA